MFKSRIVKALFLILLMKLTMISMSNGTMINQLASDFALMNINGIKKKLHEYAGKVVLVNFWASWCAPCQIELPELVRLAEEYKPDKFQLIAINVDKERSATLKIINSLKLENPNIDILLDSESKTVSAYDIDAMPSSFILDRNGMVKYIHHGFHKDDPAKWRKEITNLLTNSK